MTAILTLLALLGVAPLAYGVARARFDPVSRGRIGGRALASSVLLSALAFNLSFFWQELWLVLPKAATPGLHPVLFHNNHDWSGHAPIARLLQGTGALADLVGGLGWAVALAAMPARWPTARLFAFWMAFEGLFQGLSQVAIGAFVPGNDVGMALGYLQFDPAARWAAAAGAALAMAAAGGWLGARFPSPDARGGRATLLGQAVLPAFLAIPLIAPFRVPRDPVEVLLIPVFVTVIGTGWLIAMGGARRRPDEAVGGAPAVGVPALALLALLLVFQFGLRPGIRF